MFESVYKYIYLTSKKHQQHDQPCQSLKDVVSHIHVTSQHLPFTILIFQHLLLVKIYFLES